MAGFAVGGLVAAFYDWGWDVTSNLNEEMKDSKRSAGIGGVIGVLIVFDVFEINTIVTNLTPTPGTVSNNAGDVLAVLGQLAWPGVGGSLLQGRQTPWLATIAVAVVSLGMFIGSNYIGSLNTILTDAISAIGLQVCIYYGAAAHARLRAAGGGGRLTTGAKRPGSRSRGVRG